MAEGQLSILLTLFILLIVGITFLRVIGDDVYEATTLSDVVNETITISSGTGATENSNLTALNSFINSTDDFTAHIDTWVNWTTTGVITINMSDLDYNISYTYEGEEYVKHSTSRPLIKLMTLFFALVVLFVAVAGFLKLKKWMDF